MRVLGESEVYKMWRAGVCVGMFGGTPRRVLHKVWCIENGS